MSLGLTNYWLYLLLIRNRWVVKGSLVWRNWRAPCFCSCHHIRNSSQSSACLAALVGLPKCSTSLSNCQDWCKSLDPPWVPLLELCPLGQPFLRLGQSKLFWGWEPAIGTVQIPCDTCGSLSSAVRDWLAAWQAWVMWAPVLHISCCPAVLGCVSSALFD